MGSISDWWKAYKLASFESSRKRMPFVEALPQLIVDALYEDFMRNFATRTPVEKYSVHAPHRMFSQS